VLVTAGVNMPSTEKDVEEIRIYPAEASLLVQMLKLRMKGYTDYKIAKELSMHPISVKRRLDRVDRDFPHITKYVRTIRTSHYFRNKNIANLKSPDLRAQAVSAIERLLLQGIPLVTGSASRAWGLPGYKQIENRIEVDEKTVPLAKLIFKTFYNGGNIAELCRKHDLHPGHLRQSMENPIYIGIIGYREKEYFFRQLAIIDPEIWRACRRFAKPKSSVGANVLFAFIRRAGRLRRDPETAPKVEQVIELRLKLKTLSEIAKATDLERDLVQRILSNPKYGGNVLVNGKYIEAGEAIEEIVPFEKWLKAHNTLKGSGGKMMLIGAANMSKIWAFLRENKPHAFTCQQIAKAVNLEKTAVNRHLYKLEKDGGVERIPPERKSETPIPFPRKWRCLV